MNPAAALAVVVVLATPACKKRSVAGEALDKFRAYQEQMCACRDKACADRVAAELQRWSEEMARNEREPSPPDEAQMKEMADVGTRFGECMAKAMGQGDAPAPPRPPGTGVRNADEILKLTYDQLGSSTVSALTLSYVRADGAVDPTYGVVTIQLGKAKKPPPADDPDRPIGAPVPVDQGEVDDLLARCPKHTWKAGTRTDSEGTCMSFISLERPHCSVVEVWKQAIERGAPAQGLAVLALTATGADPGHSQTWTFAIDDAPRNVHFSLDVLDECAPTLERPTPVPPAAGDGRAKVDPFAHPHPNPY